jgi:peptidoglycan/LPS O-acetylase OafA/YrhL
MEPEITVGSIVVSVLLSLFALSRMSSSFLRWGKLCASESEEEAVAVESEEVQEEKEAGRMPEHSLSFLERYSLERAFSTLFEKEESRKVYAFSLFKILAMPFIAFGYLFFLGNYGAANYFSFEQEIYGTFYAKVAGFAYYLPDAFFFISAFVFARKLIRRDEADDGSSGLSIFGALGRRLLKLYPLYIVMILVYGFVTPSLHSGPLWVVY